MGQQKATEGGPVGGLGSGDNQGRGWNLWNLENLGRLICVGWKRIWVIELGSGGFGD